MGPPSLTDGSFSTGLFGSCPEHAIFYEATEIKQMGHAGTAKLVTAILRNQQRTGLPDLAAIADPIERLVWLQYAAVVSAKFHQELGNQNWNTYWQRLTNHECVHSSQYPC